MKSSELFRILIKDGWYKVSQSGSHILMKHKTKTGKLSFPYHGSKEVGIGLLSKLLKDAGIKLK